MKIRAPYDHVPVAQARERLGGLSPQRLRRVAQRAGVAMPRRMAGWSVTEEELEQMSRALTMERDHEAAQERAMGPSPVTVRCPGGSRLNVARLVALMEPAQRALFETADTAKEA